MSVCPNCGAELKVGAKFCSKCGCPVPAESVVSVEEVVNEIKQEVQDEGEKIVVTSVETVEEISEKSSEVTEIIDASEEVAETVADEVVETVADEAAETVAGEVEEYVSPDPDCIERADKGFPKFKIKMPEIKLPEIKKPEIKLFEGKDLKKYGIIGGAVLIVVLAIVLLCSLGGKNNGDMLDAAFYIKDGELQYSKLNDKPAFEVSSKLCSDWESEDFSDSAYDIGYQCVVTDDGKTIFYPTKIDDSADSYTLNIRQLGSKKDPVKVASDISSYKVADGGAVVFYLKEDTLHRYIVKNEDDEKICSEVNYYNISEDGKNALIKTYDVKLYLWSVKGDKEKIDSDIDSYYYPDDFSKIIYLKDDTVYSWTLKNGKEKLVKKVVDIYGIEPETGVFFYTVDDNNCVYYKDLIKGDKDSSGKFGDDNLKLYSLYFYDGKEGRLISESFLPYARSFDDESFNPFGFNRGSAVFCSIDPDSIDKVGYDKYLNSDDVGALLDEALYSGASYHAVINGKVSDLDIEDGYQFKFSPDGNSVYFITEIDSKKDEAVLYKFNINGAKLSAPELFDEDISCETLYSIIDYIYFADDSRIAYYKDIKDGEGEFYIDGKLVAEDVRRAFYYVLDDGSVVVFTDYNTKKDEGTLCSWNGKKLKEITDEAVPGKYLTLPSGSVLYLTDYNDKKCEGELNYWKNGNDEDLDEDVCAIIRVYTVSSFFD